MAEIQQEVKKVGGSLMVRIPKKIADEQKIAEGDTVFFEVRKESINLFGKYPELGGWEKNEADEFSKYA